MDELPFLETPEEFIGELDQLLESRRKGMTPKGSSRRVSHSLARL